MLKESSILEHLRGLGLPLGPSARLSSAGDGNINWVRRVEDGGRSWVVKQAGPTLAKFPEYEADPGRLLHEARYFEAAAARDPDGVCPQVIQLDAANHLLVLEDLGDALRFDVALAEGHDLRPAVERIATFLGRVHAGSFEHAELAAFPDGEAGEGVLGLHLAHIFTLPFEPNDFPLSDALSEAAQALQADAAFGARLAEVFAACRRRGPVLVHGDVQPTNVLIPESGARLLDPEMAHAGAAAFDLGLFFAHLAIDGIARNDLAGAAAIIDAGWQAYRAAGGDAVGCRFADVAAVAGVETLRRTLGAARVPAVEADPVGLACVRAGRAWVMSPPDAPSGLVALAR
ncbi:MAG: hypothetical protein AAF430_18560 [Myxococcota bacterium]